jgi:polysaccharide pyruvyl transferase WcaK-like protein
MRTEPKLVGLFGLFGVGNLGNDGSLEAALRFLRTTLPRERLLCICGDPAAVRETFGLEAIPIYYTHRPRAGTVGSKRLRKAASKAMLWLHAMRHLRRIKVLIVPGTGVLDDFGAWPLSWPFDLASWFLPARLMGVKVIFVSIGAGPIRHPLSRWLMRAAARAAHYRSYRDAVSRAFMESIGFDARSDPICPDIAFRLPAPASIRPQEEGRPLTVGVGVMAYRGWRNDSTRGTDIYAAYLEKMTTFVLWLLDGGHAVRLLMGDQADRRAVDDLLQAVRRRRPDLAASQLLFAPAHTLCDVMRQMAETDIVVATRYHNVVCALRMGRPTISIGYAAKNDDLLAEMGLAGYCQHVERLDVERLKAQALRMIGDRPAMEDRVRQAVRRFEGRLREQEALLASLILADTPAAEGTAAGSLQARNLRPRPSAQGAGRPIRRAAAAPASIPSA